jgi:hypothetical protein
MISKGEFRLFEIARFLMSAMIKMIWLYNKLRVVAATPTSTQISRQRDDPRGRKWFEDLAFAKA